ncbi:carbon-nitrogen hydrolase family protein [Sphingomonas oligophenolica]|uniref:Carbon-nitrogen hydrolase family protein n=1 Tax=Sphingomonas oligophenolica TaxID=301154 RepID=A0A502CL23_9SPHN|nr:carbon-nitrogen hydrolase family protein [Sphingomonas oligophenolica]TPG12819.1 carbon-nitrogen hydrolase family protein [Sphingomonas oligophenolica]
MKIGVLQMTSGIDPAVNARAIVKGIATAAEAGAAMIFTPEMSGLLDRDRARATASIVDEAEDGVLAAARSAAAAHRIWVHLGSLAIRGDDGRWVNRGFVIDDSGAIRARYDKLHLFDVDLASGESWRESAAYSAGARAQLIDTTIGVLGLSICYDLRFAALYAALSAAGATVLAVPAAFTRPTGAAHWHVMLRARAIESASYVVAAAQTGVHDDGRETFGHSLVIDPWGDVVLDMGDEPGLGHANLDPVRIAEVRARIPVLAHRRAIPAVTRS